MGGLGDVAIGMLGGSLISGLGGILSNQAAADQAAENRAFQERMSSTAHQREVEDLRKAGLNPILSATGGKGASTPGGAQAAMENPFKEAGSGIANAAKVHGIDKPIAEANIKNIDADTIVKTANADLARTQAENVRTDTLKKIQDTATGASQMDLNTALAAESTQRSLLAGKQVQVADGLILLQDAQRKAAEASTAVSQADRDRILQEIATLKAKLVEQQTKGKVYEIPRDLATRMTELYERAKEFWNKNDKHGASDWLIDKFRGAGTAIGTGAGNVWGGLHKAGQALPGTTP